MEQHHETSLYLAVALYLFAKPSGPGRAGWFRTSPAQDEGRKKEPAKIANKGRFS
jgi:hypothetical protein